MAIDTAPNRCPRGYWNVANPIARQEMVGTTKAIALRFAESRVGIHVFSLEVGALSLSRTTGQSAPNAWKAVAPRVCRYHAKGRGSCASSGRTKAQAVGGRARRAKQGGAITPEMLLAQARQVFS